MADDYGPLRGADEFAAFARILALAFVDTEDSTRKWVEEAGDETARGLRRGDELAAGLLAMPMGQWFGGRSVPMVGIAGVGTAPEARGAGAATELMRAAVLEMHADKTPLSVLYAASYPLYRRVGYELAGSAFRNTVFLDHLPVGRGAPLRPMRDGDEPAMRELQRELSRPLNGTLDRSDPMWRRNYKVGVKECTAYVVDGASGIDGYVFFVQRLVKDKYIIHIADIAARTPEAGRRLLGFLADHKAQIHRARWTGDAADPIVSLAETGRYEVELNGHWMLRINDVPAALEARGYPAGVTGRVSFEVEDDLIADNNGAWTLEVEGGRGTVRRGANGNTVRTSIRGLAPLYTGFMAPATLRSAGWIEAEDGTCAVAAGLFCGNAPFMYETF